jgi:hypothetical protein
MVIFFIFLDGFLYYYHVTLKGNYVDETKWTGALSSMTIRYMTKPKKWSVLCKASKGFCIGKPSGRCFFLLA